MLLDSSELDEDRVKGVKWTTAFIQRLKHRRNGGDFKFTLDDLDEYRKLTKPDGEQNMVPVNLFFLLDRMDRSSITAHARRAGMMAAYAPEIKDKYACQVSIRSLDHQGEKSITLTLNSVLVFIELEMCQERAEVLPG
jgi:hypothetical protein